MRLLCIEKSPGPEFSLNNRVLNYEFNFFNRYRTNEIFISLYINFVK